MQRTDQEKTRWLRVDSKNPESMDSLLSLIEALGDAEIKEKDGKKYVRFVIEAAEPPRRKTPKCRLWWSSDKGKTSDRKTEFSNERQYCAVMMR